MPETPSKKPVALLVIVGIVFGVSLLLVLLGLRPTEKQLVEIVQDGRVLYTLDLTSAEDQELRIEAENGSWNLVCIRDGEIFMQDAGCPDHTCVNMGVLRAENLPIVCLPNRLVIRFAQGGQT